MDLLDYGGQALLFMKVKDKCYSYYVYILQSLKDKSLYIGSSNNLDKRIVEHDLKKSKYTSKKHPYEIIWHCVFIGDNAQEKAIKFEKYLKSGSGRMFIQRHILNNKIN